jgi:hypothetical protein
LRFFRTNSAAKGCLAYAFFAEQDKFDYAIIWRWHYLGIWLTRLRKEILHKIKLGGLVANLG